MIQIIPAIDLINGECVRLTQGDYDQKTSYYKDPLEIAKRFEDIGIKRLHLVDLDGAKNSKPQNLHILERIATQTRLKIQFGGGIKDVMSLQSVWESGAQWAILGSIAVKDPELVSEWIALNGSERMILGADVRAGKIATHGWLQDAEITLDEIIDLYAQKGLHEVICTDISKDGMLQGPSISLYQDMIAKHPLMKLTASGGVSDLNDIIALNQIDIPQVIVGKAIYENRITFKDLESWLQNA